MSHIVLEVKDEGKELVKADMRMTRDSKKLTLLESTLEAPSQGMTVTLMHKNNPDQSFEGKIDGGIGNITWKGTVDTTSLTDLDITGAMAGASLSLDLKPGTD